MFDKYIDKAIQKQKLESQNQLAKQINISTAAMANLKTGKALPSEETILKVAKLAGIAPEQALIDLNIWRAKGNETRLQAWKKISKMIQLSCLMLFISSDLAMASQGEGYLNNDNQYILCILKEYFLFYFNCLQKYIITTIAFLQKIKK